MGLIDTLIYPHPQGLSLFSASDGVNVLVRTIRVSALVNERN